MFSYRRLSLCSEKCSIPMAEKHINQHKWIQEPPPLSIQTRFLHRESFQLLRIQCFYQKVIDYSSNLTVKNIDVLEILELLNQALGEVANQKWVICI